MSTNKSPPGTDGLSIEFYNVQGIAYITLIPKPSKDIRYLNNWRPIALLICDYKIAAKCLANRMKRILPDLISQERTGFLKGRFIGENVRLIIILLQVLSSS